MELLIPHECQSCGLVDEAKFVYAGPHIKQVCNGCGRYVKFYSKFMIPDPKEIELRIYQLTTDAVLIDTCKKLVGFPPSSAMDRIDEKMLYWRLYLNVREVLL